MAKATKSSRGGAKTASEDTSSNVQASNPNEDKTRQIFADFQAALIENEIAEATTEKNAAQEDLEHANRAHDIARRSFRWDRGWRFEYHKIKQEISLRLGQSALEFQGNANQAKTIRDTVQTNLNAAIQAVKLVNQKLLNILEKANHLNKVLKETGNKEDAKKLDMAVQIKEQLDTLMEKINAAYFESNDNFNTAVKTAGVAAYNNIQSLVNIANAVKAVVDPFNADVDANHTYFKGKMETSRANLDQSVTKVVEEMDDMEIATLRLGALEEVKDFSNPDQPRTVEKDIDEIVDEAEKNYKRLLPDQELDSIDIGTEEEPQEDVEEEEEEES